jgi:2-methylisocitrate lyase-like PEP mutase family enzyme
MPPASAAKRSQFKALHQRGCFVVPNPWDVGSARYLASLGFKALATTSSGFAWSLGKADGAVPLEDLLPHLRDLAAATDIPVSADFEHGYGASPAGLAAAVTSAMQTGIAGLSIEDSTKDDTAPLYAIDEAVARIRAARAAVDGGGVLTARAENFFVGRPDLEDVVKRLKAYAAAGADVLYAPGLKTEAEVAAVVKAVTPKPVNVLVGTPGLTVARLAALGVRRISVGGALARTAWGEFMRAASEIAAEGTFTRFAQAAAGRDLNTLMR